MISRPLALGVGAVGVAVLLPARKQGQGEGPFTPPREDWAVVPIAQREALRQRNGGDLGRQAGAAQIGIPIATTGDFQRIDRYWRGVAERADANRGRAESILADHEERMFRVLGAILRARSPDLFARFVQDRWGGSVVTWTTPLGSVRVTLEEGRAFWRAVDETAISVQARLSWKPAEWPSMLEAIGESAMEYGRTQTEWQLKLLGKGAEAAGEIAGAYAGGLLGPLLRNPLLLVGLGLIGYHFLRGGSQ